MKRRGLIIAVIILALIVVALVIFALFFYSAPAPTTSPLDTNPFADAVEVGTTNTAVSPATFSMNFYKWYIGNKAANLSFPFSDQLATSFSQWATPAYILQYQSERADVVNFDEDPVLYAQDDPRTWGSGLTASILSQTDTTSSVQVEVGSGSLVHTYTLQLVKTNGQWLINSIAGTN